MATPKTHDERCAQLTFAEVYPLLVTKVERKGRTKAELDQLIRWLTSYTDQQLAEHIQRKSTFETFFEEAQLHPNASLIKGVICGYRVEEIENPLTQKVRYLDKIVDELAKGKKLSAIMREPKT